MSKSLINTLSLQWDLWIGQYRAFFPTNEEDLDACACVMKEMEGVKSVKGKEVTAVSSDESNKREKVSMQLAACQDTYSGEIIACLQLVDAFPAKDLEQQYHLDFFGGERLSHLAIISQLKIQPAYQKTAAAPVLMSHCFVEILKAGGQALLMSCAPENFSQYKRLGMRPIGPLRKTAQGGFQLPMVLLPDRDYLSVIHSPVLPLIRGIDFSRYQPLCQWYYELVRENSELQIGSALYSTDDNDFEGHLTITEGLSEKGREAFLKNALVKKCKEGEVLMTEDEGGETFGFVYKGMLKVMIGDKTVVLLGEGDIFGEIAYILHTTRSAKVVAASPETEVVLFSETAVNRLKNESDRTIIWRNLARVLAQKVMMTNKLL
jgi:hypothetical protein